MADSNSLRSDSVAGSHTTGHTAYTAQTGDTETSLQTVSTVTGTNVPLVFVSAFQDEQKRNKVETLQKLPLHRFRYSVWHDLSHTEVKGPQLKAPRVRYGPPEKEEFFYKVRDDSNKRIHHGLKGKERKDYRNTTEDWENAIVANLSYQDLGHKYQMENFMRVLKRLIRVEDLNLHYDGITEFKSVSFPRCRRLVLTQNYLNSFKKLPKLPAIEVLDLSENYIQDLAGLETFRKTPLKSLTLMLNPVTFTLNYRQRVFAALPNLQLLDGIPKLPEDEEWQDDQEDKSSCVIS